MVTSPPPKSETERERFLRRAAEVRAFVEENAPECLVIEREVDESLIDWMLSLSLEDRLRSLRNMARFAEVAGARSAD